MIDLVMRWKCPSFSNYRFHLLSLKDQHIITVDVCQCSTKNSLLNILACGGVTGGIVIVDVCQLHLHKLGYSVNCFWW